MPCSIPASRSSLSSWPTEHKGGEYFGAGREGGGNKNKTNKKEGEKRKIEIYRKYSNLINIASWEKREPSVVALCWQRS